MNTGLFNRVGPYEVEREIGRGGMAVVFLAKDTRTGIDVALKQVPVGADRETREVFEAEQWGAKLQEQFSAVSALVPKVYEHRTIGDHFYVAMEYVDGENLSDAIGRGPLPFARAVTIATELARFLDAAHRFRTLHVLPVRIDERSGTLEFHPPCGFVPLEGEFSVGDGLACDGGEFGDLKG